MDEITSDLATDYANYLKIDMEDELKNVGETVEDMLTRLEEFGSLLEGVHNGGTSSLLHLGPELKMSCHTLDGLFQKIDNLEKMVATVKKDVSTMEAHLESAEAKCGIPSSDLRSFFKPLFLKNQLSSSETCSQPFEQPNIFKTSEFFPKVEDQVELK
ncbi:Hypothetical predicted protein [Cloeon dipterum]|uniref:Biogenesis of lysosome-related organelles complex 1 subunit 4 n=1 Tax=Cloeon dipterum TaxID=197152 RepID=A0A8S1DSN8_9INSE|nr:Hypothetical predicted protein [Cloeon dipterum]